MRHYPNGSSIEIPPGHCKTASQEQFAVLPYTHFVIMFSDKPFGERMTKATPAAEIEQLIDRWMEDPEPGSSENLQTLAGKLAVLFHVDADEVAILAATSGGKALQFLIPAKSASCRHHPLHQHRGARGENGAGETRRDTKQVQFCPPCFRL